MSEKYTASGQIKLIGAIQTLKNDFSKRELVITTDEKYSQDIKLEVVKDMVNVLDNYKAGDQVEVSFNIRGNEYQGKYYVNLQAWQISKQGETKTEPRQESKPNPLDDKIDLNEMENIPF